MSLKNKTEFSPYKYKLRIDLLFAIIEDFILTVSPIRKYLRGSMSGSDEERSSFLGFDYIYVFLLADRVAEEYSAAVWGL